MAGLGSAGEGTTIDDPMSAAWFAAPVCRNCDRALSTPYCAHCGQKAAKRLSFKDMSKESWERIRLFEKESVKTLWRLTTSPGLVARDYIRGRRSSQMHPLKLLVALVAILLVVLAASQYFQHFTFAGHNDDVDRMAERVIAYGNWSFTLGIVAIFLGSWIGFGRRLNLNPTEHAVLAICCQNLILACVIVNLLPTLVWRDPHFILLHKQASSYYLYGVKLGVVALAYTQFFHLKLARDWPRLAMACAIYLVASWSLLRGYAAAILWFVDRSSGGV